MAGALPLLATSAAATGIIGKAGYDDYQDKKREQGLLSARKAAGGLLVNDMIAKELPTPNYRPVPSVNMDTGALMPRLGQNDLPVQTPIAPRIGLTPGREMRTLTNAGADPVALWQMQQQQKLKQSELTGYAPGTQVRDASGNLKFQVPFAPPSAPAPPASLAEYAQAQRDGFKGSYMEFRMQLARAAQAPKGAPSTKFAFDRNLGKNRSVTDEEMNEAPGNFAPPLTAPTVDLYDKSGNKVGAGDPNDAAIRARIESGEVSTRAPKQFTGEQSKAAAYANDALTSEANIMALMSPEAPADGSPTPKAFDPTGAGGNIFKGMDSWAMSNQTSTPELQRYEQAMSNWGMAVLRQESGGAVTPEEGLLYARTFFPKWGDKPETVAQKKRQREEKVRGLIAASGGAYEANFGNDKSQPSIDDLVAQYRTK